LCLALFLINTDERRIAAGFVEVQAALSWTILTQHAQA
ncbi:hypothetical protein PSYJA_45441, partial [Pseudomonas syringae pv. japonica str. M301072]